MIHNFLKIFDQKVTHISNVYAGPLSQCKIHALFWAKLHPKNTRFQLLQDLELSIGSLAHDAQCHENKKKHEHCLDVASCFLGFIYYLIVSLFPPYVLWFQLRVLLVNLRLVSDHNPVKKMYFLLKQFSLDSIQRNNPRVTRFLKSPTENGLKRC